MAKRKEIRNSTAEFLIFQIEGKEQGVEVFYKDKTVWCTQKAMGMLFDVNIPAISKHLKNIYEQGELTEERTVSKMEIVRMEGNRQVKRETVFYNLDAVISVGYRVNSIRATQFRQWATSVLREFAIRGYVLDKKRMENDKTSYSNDNGGLGQTDRHHFGCWWKRSSTNDRTSVC